MNPEQIEQAIRDKLREREKQVVNRNALAALLSAFGLGPLGKIFLGRKGIVIQEEAMMKVGRIRAGLNGQEENTYSW